MAKIRYFRTGSLSNRHRGFRVIHWVGWAVGWPLDGFLPSLHPWGGEKSDDLWMFSLPGFIKGSYGSAAPRHAGSGHCDM